MGAGSRCPAASADDDQRALGILKAVAQLCDLLRTGRNDDRLDAFDVSDVYSGRKHILRQCENDRASAPRERHAERARHVFGNPLRPIDLRDPLGNAAVHLPIVDFLKCLSIGEIAANLTNKNDQGRGVLLCGVDADCSVGRTRSARDEDDAGTARELAVRLAHVGGASLLPADDEPQALAHVVERVEDRQVTLARDAEGEVDALSKEIVDEDAAAGAHESSEEYEKGAAILHAARANPGSYNRPGPARRTGRGGATTDGRADHAAGSARLQRRRAAAGLDHDPLAAGAEALDAGQALPDRRRS